MPVFEYKRDADALYIRISANTVDRTVEIDPGTLVDIDRSGNAVGIELIAPARPWPLKEIAERVRISDETMERIRATASNNHSLFPYTKPLEPA